MSIQLPHGLQQLWRRLSATPGFTAVALLTIAAGIGANATIFSVVHTVLLKPLPYPEPDRLVAVWHSAPAVHVTQLNASPSTYFIYREHSRVFADIGLWNTDSLSVTGAGEPEQAAALDVTDGTLPLLGVRTAVGRLFTKHDVEPAAPPTAILTDSYWHSRFGGSPTVIGQRIRLDGTPTEIIGVLPPQFRFLDQHPAIVVPLSFDRSKLFLGNFSYNGIARLRPGVTLAQANEDVNRMLPIFLRSYPPPPGYNVAQFASLGLASNLKPLAQEIAGDVGPTLWVLMGMISVVLLIACANVANLLLVRVEGQQREFAIRAALGASWSRLAAGILSECLALSIAGGVLGLVAALGALKLLVYIAPSNLPRLDEMSVDKEVVLFTVAIAVVCGLLCGLIPVLKYAGARVGTALKQGGRTSSMSRERHNARNALVIVQVTLALVLLVGSGLMMRTARALTQVDPGFQRPGQIETLQVAIPDERIAPERVLRMQQEMLRRISDIPGVRKAALSGSVPMDEHGSFDPVFARDKKYDNHEIAAHRYEFVSPGFFGTIGARLAAGRDFEWSDLVGKHPVAMVSEPLARLYWGSPEAAIGKEVRESLSGQWREVIGVARPIRYNGMTQEAPTAVYWPILAYRFRSEDISVQRTLTFVVSSGRAGNEEFAKEIRQAVWAVDSSLPVANVSTLAALVKRSQARTSFTLVLLCVAAAMALLLGVIGIYGAIAYSVSQRTREIGIRVAVGAKPEQVIGMFVRSGLALTGAGLLLGLVLSAFATRLMTSLLFGVSPLDPATYAAGCAVLLSASLLASYGPSRQALRIDPAQALRGE